MWNSGGSGVLPATSYGGSPEYAALRIGPRQVVWTTIYSVGFDANGAATFSVGGDRLTVNQDQFGDNNGIRVSTTSRPVPFDH